MQLLCGQPIEYWLELQDTLDSKHPDINQKILEENARLRRELGVFKQAASDAYRILGQVMNETK